MSKTLWLNENQSIELAETMQPLADELATRQRCDYYSLLGSLPDPDIVLRKMGKDILVYEEHLSDPHVGACFDRRKAGVKKRIWEIDRGKAKSAHSKFIESVFNNEEFLLDQAISEILDAPYFGYQPLEITWAPRDGYIVPAKVTAKPPEWFCFGNNNELLLRTRQNYSGEPLPEKKFLLAQNDPRYKNPYGRKIGSRIFWYATFKRNGLKWWVTFVEKFGIPYIIGKTPRGTGKPDNDKLMNELANMVKDAVAVIPDDTSVEILTSDSKGSGNTPQHAALIDYCDKSISKAFLGHSAAADSTPGKLGGEDVSMGATQDIIDSDSKLVCQVMNTLISWTIDINFGPNALRPKFALYDEEDVDQALAERDKALADAGICKFTEKYLQKNYAFEDGDIVVPDPNAVPPGAGPSPAASAGSMPDGTVALADGGPAQAVTTQIKTSAGDQAEVNELLNSLSADQLQAQLDGDLRPVIELIESAASYEEVQEKLAGVFPNMDDAAMETNLAKAMFLADVKGRMATNTLKSK